jgi:hypothetical protein
MPPNPLPPPRSALVVEVQDRVMELLREHGATRQLRPDEALIAIELTFITLFDNAMDVAMKAPAANEAEYTERAKLEIDRHQRTLVRLQSRVQAWPARPLDSKQRM